MSKMLAVPLTNVLKLRDYVATNARRYDQTKPWDCVVGMALELWSDAKQGWTVHDRMLNVARILGVTDKQISEIFAPGDHDNQQPVTISRIHNNALWACSMLSNLAITGEVDWPGTEPRDD